MRDSGGRQRRDRCPVLQLRTEKKKNTLLEEEKQKYNGVRKCRPPLLQLLFWPRRCCHALDQQVPRVTCEHEALHEGASKQASVCSSALRGETSWLVTSCPRNYVGFRLFLIPPVRLTARYGVGRGVRLDAPQPVAFYRTHILTPTLYCSKIYSTLYSFYILI